MKAIVVRDSSGKILAFGQDDGNYDPGVPAGATKGLIDDVLDLKGNITEHGYDKAQTEWNLVRGPELEQERLATVKQQRLDEMIASLADPVVVALLKDKLGVK